MNISQVYNYLNHDLVPKRHTHAQGFRTQSGLQQYFQIQSVIPALSGFPLGIETGAYD